MQTLTTQRLILRSFAERDLTDLYEYAKSPDVGPSAGWKPHQTPERTAATLKTFMESGEVWAIEHKDSHKNIGWVELHDDEKRPDMNAKMIGYVLAPDYWGQGLMTEAVRRVMAYTFDELAIDTLAVYHYPANNRSKSVILKCGFHYEGRLRQAAKGPDGSFYDDVCYSITKSEYKA